MSKSTTKPPATAPPTPAPEASATSTTTCPEVGTMFSNIPELKATNTSQVEGLLPKAWRNPWPFKWTDSGGTKHNIKKPLLPWGVLEFIWVLHACNVVILLCHIGIFFYYIFYD